MTLGGSTPAGIAVPSAFAALGSVPSHEYDLQALLADPPLAPAKAPSAAAKKRSATSAVAAPAVTIGAPSASASSAGFAPMIAFPFALDPDCNLDFTGSFLASAPAAAMSATSGAAAPAAPSRGQARAQQQQAAEEDENLYEYEGSVASSDEWLDEFDFGLAGLASSGSGSGSGSHDGSGAPATKRPRHRPTVHVIRQRQQSQLEKLNARNDELKSTISTVNTELDQVKRLICQLLKKKGFTAL